MTGIDQSALRLHDTSASIEVVVSDDGLCATLLGITGSERAPLEATARWIADAWRPTRWELSADTLVITSDGPATEHDARITLEALVAVRSASSPFQALGERAAFGWRRETPAAEAKPLDTAPAEADPLDASPAETPPLGAEPAQGNPLNPAPARPRFEQIGSDEVASHEATSHEATSHEATSHEAASQDAASHEATSQKAAPDEAQPKTPAFESIGLPPALHMPDVGDERTFTLTLSDLGSEPERATDLLRQALAPHVLDDELSAPLEITGEWSARDVRRIMVGVSIGTDALFTWAPTA